MCLHIIFTQLANTALIEQKELVMYEDRGLRVYTTITHFYSMQNKTIHVMQQNNTTISLYNIITKETKLISYKNVCVCSYSYTVSFLRVNRPIPQIK